MTFDNFTEKHLDNWLQNNYHEEEREEIKQRILSVLEDYPELLNDRTWWEILDFTAEKQLFDPIEKFYASHKKY